MEQSSKFCNGCKQTLPLDSFSIKNGPKAPKDGHRSRCKLCENAASKIYSATHRDTINANKRRWNKDNPDKKSAMDKRYREKYPEKVKANSQKWQAENRDHVRAYRANRTPEQKERKRLQDIEYARNNPHKNLEATRRYRANHPERTAASAKKYRQNNPEKMALKAMKRRAWKIEGGVYLITVKELQRLYSGSCAYCGSTENIEIDHVVPLARGGRHSIGNLVSACQFCNRSKNKKTITEWRKWQRGLNN